jgi:hypothetical protein
MLLNGVLGVLVLLLAYLAWRFSTETTRLRAQYAPILQMDAAVAAAKEELDRTRAYLAKRMKLMVVNRPLVHMAQPLVLARYLANGVVTLRR